MSEEKKAIIRDLSFGGLMHIPPLRVHHKLLKELANSFKLGKNTLETGYGSFRVKPSTIGAALGLNASGDLFPQKDRLMFKRIFILYIQMAFLLPTTINKISPVHLAPIFKMDKIKEGNWRAHVLDFIIKGITDYNLKKKKSIDGCLFALMIVYFHLSKNKDKKGEERPAQPWIANWNREQLVERMRAEMDEHMGIVKMAETKDKLKQMKKKEKKEKKEGKVFFNNDCLPSRMESKKRKKNQEDSNSETESNDESEIRTEELEEFLRESRKKKNNEKSVAQGIPEVNLGSDDSLSQGHTDQSNINKPTESMLNLVEESANDPTEENMMVVRVETQSQTEALSIVPIQVYLPLSQSTPVPEIEPTPTKSPSEKINEETRKR
ncbi:hypothetical protein Ahy_B07g087399 [Arachis hypogaea]|uniref:Aminotransferase-like plant mobile domain-containing protein n=1 Tax=Arachis hypogaea TaxID=3818 RepID=A0A444YBY6_ARAHY|nr:hypothetical protein Ahy_B07g087399 [Arachis hypogaea]